MFVFYIYRNHFLMPAYLKIFIHHTLWIKPCLEECFFPSEKEVGFFQISPVFNIPVGQIGAKSTWWKYFFQALQGFPTSNPLEDKHGGEIFLKCYSRWEPWSNILVVSRGTSSTSESWIHFSLQCTILGNRANLRRAQNNRQWTWQEMKNRIIAS